MKKFLRLPPVGVGVADEAVVVISSITFVEEIRFLFVRVALALFFVASLVLSTFHRPTSHLTIPVGVFITGEVRVLFVRVSVVAFHTRVSLAPVGNVSTQPDTVIAAILGVVSAGELENTRTQPLPVSSLITPAS